MPLPSSWHFDAIGTHWTIWTEIEIDDDSRRVVTLLVDRFDRYYSRFRDDSLVNTARENDTLIFPSDSRFDELFGFYRELYDLTDGAVTPLTGDTLSSLGYDKAYSLKPIQHTSKVSDIDDVIEWDRAFSITYKKPAILDFGAAGKGLLVDLIAERLKDLGHESFVIDASGDMMHRSDVTYKIGLEDPHDMSKVIGIIELSNESLCGSSINRRSWGNGLHHVIDGRTSMPTEDIVATWVIDKDSTMKADGFATALFFVDNNEMPDHHGRGYLRIKRDGTIEMNEIMKERVRLFTR